MSVFVQVSTIFLRHWFAELGTSRETLDIKSQVGVEMHNRFILAIYGILPTEQESRLYTYKYSFHKKLDLRLATNYS